MTTLKMTVCDACSEPAHPDYLAHFRLYGWLHVEDGLGGMDICSWECLATVVATRIADRVEDSGR